MYWYKDAAVPWEMMVIVIVVIDNDNEKVEVGRDGEWMGL